MLQGLGGGFDAGLADVVGRIAGRIGDALLGASVDDEGGCALIDHGLRERLHTVDDAPQVNVQDVLPLFECRPCAGFLAGTGVVHEHIDATEVGVGTRLERRDRGELRDIDDLGFDTLARASTHRARRGFKARAVDIRHQHMHAEAGVAPRGGESDAIGGSCDDGNFVGREDLVMGHGLVPQLLDSHRDIERTHAASVCATPRPGS